MRRRTPHRDPDRMFALAFAIALLVAALWFLVVAMILHWGLA